MVLSLHLLFILPLFLLGSYGVFFNKKNFILSIISLEIILLSILLLLLINSLLLDVLFGQIASFIVLAIGASESAIGLSLTIVYYRNYKYNY